MRVASLLRPACARSLHHCPPPPPPAPPRSAGIIGAPFSKGQPRDGVQRGPDLIRAAGLRERLQELGCAVKDYGNLVFEEESEDPVGGPLVGGAPSGGSPGGGTPLGVAPRGVRAVGRANRRLAQAVRKAKEDGHTAVMLGGDHSLALGSVRGHWEAVGRLSVLWVDAHADVNTPLTSPTGNLHGQPLSLLLHELQDKVPPLPPLSWLQPCLWAADLVYVGLRDLDPAEHFILRRLGVKLFSMSEVDRLGISRVMEEALDYLSTRGNPLHLSYDVDAIDPAVTPATGTPVPGGLTYREGVYITEQLCQTGLLSAVDLVELNPLRGRSQQEVGSSVSAALDVLLGCFGRRRGGNHPPGYQLPEP